MSFRSTFILSVACLLLGACASKEIASNVPVAPAQTVYIQPNPRLHGIQTTTNQRYFVWKRTDGSFCWTENPKPGTDYPQCPRSDFYSVLQMPDGSVILTYRDGRGQVHVILTYRDGNGQVHQTHLQ